ncbi:MAG TPA: ABC transporter ATP-binding protein [Thermoanaerobaculia bacterium]|nr:ABC transporter ATP-binding protein [Thermoanaerobaculia bacterium]
MADAKPKRKLSRERMKELLNDAGQLIWRSRKRLLIGFPLMFINRGAGIVIPGTSKYVIDLVIGKGRHDLLWKIALVAGVASVISGITDYLLSQLLGQAAQRSITELRRRIHEHVQRLPVRYFDSTKTGVIVARVMNDAEGIRNLIGTGLVQLFGGLITATVAIGILFWLSTKLATFIAIALAFFAVILWWAFRTARPLFRKRGEVNAEVTGRLTEGLSGIRIVKAYRAEKHEERVFTKGAHRLLRLVVDTMNTVSTMSGLSSMLAGVVGMLILWFGAREVIAHRMTMGDLVSFIVYLGLVIGPVAQIVAIGTQLSEAFAGLERMREILGETTEDVADPEKPFTPAITGDVEFRDVWFEYSEGVPVLKGISFNARAGKSTALVGPSGSGKSTLIALVAAFNRPTAGTILIDGKDLDDLRLADYRSHIGLVPQESFLFADSIYDNISMGNPKATREEVLEAAHIAHVDDFADTFADKYDTIVGERGVKLSGGQRQRVAIARAIVADPRILILDEATSSLDSESEALIQDGLNKLMEGRTTFVIAHRLSTIRNADQIVVIEDGRVLERGTHDELMELGGRYRALYEKQYGIAINLFVNPGEELRDLAVTG